MRQCEIKYFHQASVYTVWYHPTVASLFSSPIPYNIGEGKKKLQLLSENLQEVAAVGWAYFGYLPFAEVRPRSEVNTCGSDLTLGSHIGACGNVA